MTQHDFGELQFKACVLEIGGTVVTACFITIAVALWITRAFVGKTAKQKEKRLPPGPRGVPILGYLPFIWKPFHVVFNDLSKKYGAVIRLRLGCRDVVVLNDLDSIRKGMTNPDVLYRPEDFTLGYLGSQEIQCFVSHIASAAGQPVSIPGKLAASVANNTSALVLGQRYELDDPRGRYIEELVSKFLRHGNVLSVLDFLPAVRYVFKYLPWTDLCIFRGVLKNLAEVVRTEVRKREENKNAEEYFERDFIDGYTRKIEEYKGANSHFSLRHLEGNATSLYSAGTNTIRTAVLWNLYIVASDPDGVQARIQREIDATIGQQWVPQWGDSARYDTEICGYHIPAGTFVIPNLWSLHTDPAHWRNPSQYDPTRFLNSDGTELAKKPAAFLPFSVGRYQTPLVVRVNNFVALALPQPS
ncbi:hypothetical protein HPB50_025835 [Hyalomma asiaticum]|uniref:Uncharacterized protein n=1 Tax=Hyalomma asiaticum TaxID=266040 RepID=A0ACB7STT9_HYAAI|nr:hypothetical protein HPB50_025835 [Hyalomma asiaticum]